MVTLEPRVRTIHLECRKNLGSPPSSGEAEKDDDCSDGRFVRTAPLLPHPKWTLLQEEEYCAVKLPAAHYTADYKLTYADGRVDVVEIKSKFTRKAQRDYIYRRRLFIDLIAKPQGWGFVEIITPDTKAETKEWKRLAEQAGKEQLWAKAEQGCRHFTGRASRTR